MSGISVCLIVKNCAAALGECLASLKLFLRPEDEVVVVDTGSNDMPNGIPGQDLVHPATVNVAENNGCRVFRHPDLNGPGMLDLVKKYLPDEVEKCSKDPQFSDGFLTDFAAARVLAEGHAKNDLIFWLDSDDVLVGAASLRSFVEEFFKDPSHKILFLPYEYSYDTDGSCNTLLWRERLYRKGLYHWKGKCHEALLPNDVAELQVHRPPDMSIVVQHKNSRHHTLSDIRNYVLLRDSYESAEWKDPRTEFYLGNACRGLQRWDEAIRWYCSTLQRSGSRDDRLTAALNVGYAYLQFNRPWKALDWFFQATKIWVEEPRAYFGIAKCYFDLHRWRECLIWTQIGFSLGVPQHITAVDPLSFSFYPHVFEILSLQKTGMLDAALRIAEQLVAQRPAFEPARLLYQEMMNAKGGEIVKSSILTTIGMAFSEDAQKEICARIKPEVRKQFAELQVEPYATKPIKSVTFFCGKTLEPWDGSSLQNGIGGSEKMVIQLGERLAVRGWSVDVYGHPKPENFYKSFRGVIYRPSESLDLQHPRDIVVLWRSPALLDAPWRARKVLVDLHDVPQPAEFTPARLAKTAGVIFKSAYHRSLAPSVPGAKAVVLRNAIDVPLLEKVERSSAHSRSFHKIVWTSSADRGLRGALLAYAHMKNDFPDSEFHVFYGFTPLFLEKSASQQHQWFGDCGCDRNMLDYAEETFELMERLQVIPHGRVSTEELYHHLLTAGIWLYPTLFPEISCISAMEAQACGAFPLCSDTAALKETVQDGCFILPTGAAEIAAAIRGVMLRGADLDEYRKTMMASARTRFSLDTLVDAWEECFHA